MNWLWVDGHLLFASLATVPVSWLVFALLNGRTR